jgi:hypothetical protein
MLEEIRPVQHAIHISEAVRYDAEGEDRALSACRTSAILRS